MRYFIFTAELFALTGCVHEGTTPSGEKSAVYSDGTLLSDPNCDDTSPVMLDGDEFFWLQTCSGTTTLKHADLNPDLTFEKSSTTIAPNSEGCMAPSIGSYATGSNYMTGLEANGKYFLVFVYNDSSNVACLVEISSDGTSAISGNPMGSVSETTTTTITQEIIAVAIDPSDNDGGGGSPGAGNPLLIFTRTDVSKIDKYEFAYNGSVYGDGSGNSNGKNYSTIEFDNRRYPQRIAYFAIPYDLGEQSFLVLPAITIEDSLGLINPEVFANDDQTTGNLIKPASTGLADLTDISSGKVDKDPWCDRDGRIYFASTRETEKFGLFRVNSPTIEQRIAKILQFLGL